MIAIVIKDKTRMKTRGDDGSKETDRKRTELAFLNQKRESFFNLK